jgi:hypothetical protein
MDDGKHGIINDGGRNLFADFSEVAERTGGEGAAPARAQDRGQAPGSPACSQTAIMQWQREQQQPHPPARPPACLPSGPLTWKLLLNPCPASACRSLTLPALPAVYQASDYCDIMEHLIERWDVGHREGLRGDAAEAQVRAGCVGLGAGRVASGQEFSCYSCRHVCAALPPSLGLAFVAWPS